jgi:hypothetical protein
MGNQMANDNLKQRQDVIFFFGAGASVDAGIPDTYQFVEDFKAYVKNTSPSFYEQLVRILEIRETFNEKHFRGEKKQVDVEQLLSTLEHLIEKDKEPLLDFYERKKFNSNLKAENFLQLKKLLEEFIREKVIVEDEKKLEYLKELLKFDTPLEIYSTNYDTCIEQLSHINHLRYTDGFDIYWNGENFNKDFDVKHFKVHGSVIWYENKKTKEIVKIPVHGFIEGKKVDLRLIYGEDVKPLLIYPAQKPEYIEPLTELQLMFKKRLIDKKTKILVIVGYSFRDDYIIHMLWDASRINDDLHILLVSPTAQEHYENKLKFIDRDKKALSRIHDRVVCLPYPFSTVIYLLKNHYVRKLNNICRIEKEHITSVRFGQEPEWENLLRMCIDCEFSTKAENILKERIGKSWHELPFDMPQNQLLYGVKGLLHSVIAKDGFEQEWVNRVNESLKVIGIENLDVSDLNPAGFKLVFKHSEGDLSFKDLVERWINPVLDERGRKLKLLSPRFEKALRRTDESFENLRRFRDYLSRLKERIHWQEYLKLRSKSKERESIIELLNNQMQDTREGRIQVLSIEKRELAKVIEENTLQFQLRE